MYSFTLKFADKTTDFYWIWLLELVFFLFLGQYYNDGDVINISFTQQPKFFNSNLEIYNFKHTDQQFF